MAELVALVLLQTRTKQLATAMNSSLAITPLRENRVWLRETIDNILWTRILSMERLNEQKVAASPTSIIIPPEAYEKGNADYTQVNVLVLSFNN